MFKKAITLSASKFLEKTFSFLIVIILTHIFSKNEVGRFFYYFSLVSLTIPAMDFGLRKILVINWDSKQTDSNKKLISSILITKLFLGTTCLSLVLALDFLINGKEFSPVAVSLCFVAIFSDELSQLFRAPDHANEKYGYEMLIPLLSKFFCLLTIFTFKDNLTTIEDVLVFYACWNTISALICSFSFLKYNPVFDKAHFSKNYSAFLKQGYAFSLTGFFVMISFYIDSVILGAFSMEETGVYNCAFRIVLVFGILSTGFSHVLFTKFAKNSHKSIQESGKFLSNAVPLVITLFVSIAIGTMALSSQAVGFLYDETFSEAAIILVLLAPFVLLSAVSNIFAHTLEACGLQKKVMSFNIISCSFNLITNLIFIPIWGMYAAAVTTVCTELLNVSLSYILLRNSGVNPFSSFPKKAYYLILAIIITGIIAHFLSLVPGILLGAIVFIPFYLKIFKQTTNEEGELQCAS
jgi:O-antigen/teichoic acid export membrane protein